jgi:hypothetical protein
MTLALHSDSAYTVRRGEEYEYEAKYTNINPGNRNGPNVSHRINTNHECNSTLTFNSDACYMMLDA